MVKMHCVSGHYIINGRKVPMKTSFSTRINAIGFVNEMNRKGDELTYDGEKDVDWSVDNA